MFKKNYVLDEEEDYLKIIVDISANCTSEIVGRYGMIYIYIPTLVMWIIRHKEHRFSWEEKVVA